MNYEQTKLMLILKHGSLAAAEDYYSMNPKLPQTDMERAVLGVYQTKKYRLIRAGASMQ